MKKGKNIFKIVLILSLLLFASGTGILFYYGSSAVSSALFEDSDTNSHSVNDILAGFFSKGKPVNFLVLVGDQWGSNTDTILLANYNPRNSNMNMLSIPRDTKVNIKGMSIPKINGVFGRKDGAQLLLDTVSELLAVKINYYVYFNISTVKDIIDQLGGVKYNVPFDMDYDDPTQNLHIHLKKGLQTLDGDKAEQFLRFRHPNGSSKTWSKEVRQFCDGSDLFRIQSQQGFIKELLKQKVNIGNIGNISKTIDLVFDNLKTNITLDEIFSMLKSIKGFSTDKVQMHNLPIKSLPGRLSYVGIREKEAHALMSQYFSSSEPLKSVTNVNSEKPATPQDVDNSNASTTKKPSTTKSTNSNVTKDNPSNSSTKTEKQPTPLP